MSTTRRVKGHVHLPPDVTAGTSGEVTVELRDVSELDAPSRLRASVQLPTQALKAGDRLPFELHAPEADARRALSLRVQIVGGPSSGAARDAMFLSTQSNPVASQGDVLDAQAPVSQVS